MTTPSNKSPKGETNVSESPARLSDEALAWCESNLGSQHPFRKALEQAIAGLDLYQRNESKYEEIIYELRAENTRLSRRVIELSAEIKTLQTRSDELSDEKEALEAGAAEYRDVLSFIERKVGLGQCRKCGDEDPAGFEAQKKMNALSSSAGKELQSRYRKLRAVARFYATYSPEKHPEGFYEINVAPGEGGEVRFGTFAREALKDLGDA